MISIYLLLLVFFVCFSGILVTAYFSIDSIKEVSYRFNLSDSFMGAVFLAIGTSFPEFINSIIAGFNDRNKDTPTNAIYSLYNVTGANVWQIVFLIVSIAGIAFYSKIRNRDFYTSDISNIFWNNSFLSWKLVLLDTFVLFLLFAFPKITKLFIFKGFNLLNLFFLGIWSWYIGKTYNQTTIKTDQDRSKYFTNFPKVFLILITLFLWLLFGAFAYGNFYISSLIPIGTSTSFGILLSFITSTPEFSVLYFLFKQREYKMAVGGFFGSSLFNLILPTFTNLISLNPVVENLGMRNWLILNLILIIFFLFSFVNKKKPEWFMIVNGILVFSIYVCANLFFVF